MQLLTLLFILCCIGCNSRSNNDVSFWETKKAYFKYQDKREFVSDSALRSDYKTLKKYRHPLFDNYVATPVYLYSWQETDKAKNAFTVVEDDGELGLKIIYFIVDKKGKLVSRTQVAGRGSEGGFVFETRSKFVSKDTLLEVGAITKWLDFEKREKMKKTKGDSTFSHLCIDSSGKITRSTIKEIIELDFKNHNN